MNRSRSLVFLQANDAQLSTSVMTQVLSCPEFRCCWNCKDLEMRSLVFGDKKYGRHVALSLV